MDDCAGDLEGRICFEEVGLGRGGGEEGVGCHPAGGGGLSSQAEDFTVGGVEEGVGGLEGGDGDCVAFLLLASVEGGFGAAVFVVVNGFCDECSVNFFSELGEQSRVGVDVENAPV